MDGSVDALASSFGEGSMSTSTPAEADPISQEKQTQGVALPRPLGFSAMIGEAGAASAPTTGSYHT